MSVVLNVKGLSKQYLKFRLHDVSFEIQRGTIMGLIGRNGQQVIPLVLTLIP